VELHNQLDTLLARYREKVVANVARCSHPQWKILPEITGPRVPDCG
jgi:hypothetical protein